MSTIGDRYPELTELHREFTRALGKDKKPKFPEAFFWYQAIDFDRDPRKPSARCRGHEQLVYLNRTTGGGTVPDQKFAPDKTPAKVCTALISRHAADMEGPYQINFRYSRNSEGIWVGFYTIETSRQHEEIVAGRAPYDDAIGAALRATWKDGMTSHRLGFGSMGNDPGPKVLSRTEAGSTREDADPALAEAWQALVEYLKGCGVREIYYADYALTKPNTRLRDGDNVQVIYGMK